MKIGQVLRSKRESLGMTLVDLEKKISIQKKFIELIEKNEFDKLPNPDYTKGFIEKYATSVNLNAQALLEKHHDELPNKTISAKDAIIQIKKSEKVKKPDISAQKLLLMLLGILLVLFAVWFICSELIFTNKDNSFQAKNINESRNVSVETPKEEPSKTAKNDNEKKSESKDKQAEPKDSKANITYKSFDGSVLAYEVNAKDAFKIKIDSKTPTWVQMYDDQKKTYAYKQINSSEYEIDKEAKNVTLISGNSTALNVYIDGQKISVPNAAQNLITRTYYFTIIKK